MSKRRLIVRNSVLRVRDPPREVRRSDREIHSRIFVQRELAPSFVKKPRKRGAPSARSKLNWAALNGAIVIAALVAGVTQSLWAGAVILILLLVEAVATGQIRWRRRD